MCDEQKMIPVKKATWLIQKDEYLDFSDAKRFGEFVVGGVIVNLGGRNAVIDDLIDLPTGTRIPIGIQWPYCDKSNFKISFTGGGTDQRVALIIYKRVDF